MIRRVKARAYANIAICKYWGKQSSSKSSKQLNLPATPSISLALKELCAETVVSRIQTSKDRVIINGKSADQKSLTKIKAYLSEWRKQGLIEGHFEINSVNNFPTGAGLASSSAGYAALAKALSGFTKKMISLSKLSRLARLGSGSAARSVTGGLSRLPAGTNSSASLIKSAEEIEWGMVVAVVNNNAKEIGSTEGMNLSRKTSPYYKDWVLQAEKDYIAMLKAIRRNSLDDVGKICENNTMSMHACMIATRPSLLYWNAITINVIHAVRDWREKGLRAWFTIDAGPNVIVLTHKNNLRKVAKRIRSIKGIIKIIPSLPGDGAEIIEMNDA